MNEGGEAGVPQKHGLGSLRGFLSLSEDPPLMTSHGNGALTKLISSPPCCPSSRLGRDSIKADDSDSIHRRGRSTSRRLSVLNVSQMRSERLIGNNNPRYRWERYWKTDEELRSMKGPIRKYYKRNNALIQQYLYIDRLLDSSLPSDLLNEYSEVETTPASSWSRHKSPGISEDMNGQSNIVATLKSSNRIRRTPRDLYKFSAETTPLIHVDEGYDGPKPDIPGIEDDSVETGDKIVQIAIYVNLVANIVLLAGKILVTVLTSSLSVLASLVDSALDFLSTAIVWTTARLVGHQDIHQYPTGRRKLEPVSILIFSVIMIVSFVQVALECISRLTSGDRSIIEVGLSAILVMTITVAVKACCWFWCRMVKNSSVQALAQDAMTDCVFNIFSIIFPLIGYYANLYWLDATGGLLLSCYVVINWSSTSLVHIKNLTGQTATSDERNILLYLTMRFAKSIKQVQGLQAYHAGDKLLCEVDIVLDQDMPLKDSHDLSESLQYVLESVPIVERAFVHTDYIDRNLPTHMAQQDH